MARRKNQHPYCAFIPQSKTTKVTISMETDNELGWKAEPLLALVLKKSFQFPPFKSKTSSVCVQHGSFEWGSGMMELLLVINSYLINCLHNIPSEWITHRIGYWIKNWTWSQFHSQCCLSALLSAVRCLWEKQSRGEREGERERERDGKKTNNPNPETGFKWHPNPQPTLDATISEGTIKVKEISLARQRVSFLYV